MGATGRRKPAPGGRRSPGSELRSVPRGPVATQKRPARKRRRRTWRSCSERPSLSPLAGSEGVPEVVFRDLPAEDNAGDAREVVVQARPESGVDDLVAEVVWRVEVPYRVQVPGRPGGVEAVNVEVDLVG